MRPAALAQEAVHLRAGLERQQHGLIAGGPVADDDGEAGGRLDARDARQGAQPAQARGARGPYEGDLGVLALHLRELAVGEDVDRVDHAPGDEHEREREHDPGDRGEGAAGVALDAAQHELPARG